MTPTIGRRRPPLAVLLTLLLALDTAMYSSVAPLIPDLQAQFNLSGTQIGVLVAAHPFGLFLFAVPAGLKAGRWGARLVVVVGAAMLAAASIGFALAINIELLVAMRFAQGASAALVWAGVLAWLSTGSNGRNGSRIGTAVGASISGSVLGPLIGVAAVGSTHVLIFGVVALVSLLVGLATLFHPSPPSEGKASLRPVAVVFFTPRSIAISWVVALCSGTMGTLAVQVPLRLKGAGGSTYLIGTVFVVIALLMIASNPVVGRAHDSVGPVLPLATGTILGAAALVTFFALDPLVGIILAAVLSYVLVGLMITPSFAAFSELGARHGLAVGGVYGLANFAWGAGQGVGAFASGWSRSHGTVHQQALLTAALLAATGAMLWLNRGGRARSFS